MNGLISVKFAVHFLCTSFESTCMLSTFRWLLLVLALDPVAQGGSAHRVRLQRDWQGFVGAVCRLTLSRRLRTCRTHALEVVQELSLYEEPTIIPEERSASRQDSRFLLVDL